MRCYQRGLTIIELAVILLILGICVVVTFPKFDAALLNQYRLRSNVNRIASIAEYAHHQAICSQSTHLLHINTVEGTYWVTGEAPDDEAVSIPAGLPKGRLPEGVQFTKIEFRGTNTCSQDIVTVEFSPQGWIEPATALVVSSRGRKMSIVMDELSGSIETSEIAE